MPNHITSNLEIKGSTKEIKKFRDFMKAKPKAKWSKDSDFDFNNILQMPESLMIEVHDC